MNDRKFDMDTVNRFFEYDYHNRGMVKWQGFYLSDHTAALDKLKTKNAISYPAKNPQSLSEISSILTIAHFKNQTVSLQLNTVDQNNQHLPTITTRILGYNAATVIISDRQFINMNNIRHVELTKNSAN
ncbi:hypothetical protein RXV91_14225 [Lactiplantibacillus sp. DA1]|uniref:hypothetical protein n=1 Tax=Lactiplantibacillus sp. DA1 TaxID=3079857 RepID=UPI00292A63C8|nr:hypothetical protein [Lactiplantibacillus sp. DA1]MDV0432026.1 hypothetical protein [Lactiplantibacillus sp. DA1]